ncbi:MAG: tRNA epoxyqueuosine(34) reductase QueG [Anaerolineales bacterium]
MSNANELAAAIKTEAGRLGFSPVGITAAYPAPHFDAFSDWVQAGYHARMNYLSREDTLSKREDPRLILDDCQCMICLALPYLPPKRNADAIPPGRGLISAYARIPDYHNIIQSKLTQLEQFIQQQTEDDVHMVSYVDTGPVLERSFASQAGLGIAGKNTCLLIQGRGSYFFLAEILINLDLPVDEPFTKDLCGSCQRCVEACPTGCILPNRTIDARRCISYLTIENKGSIPNDLKEKIGPWAFGCDLCQMVCPHNQRKTDQATEFIKPILPEHIDLLEIFVIDAETFSTKFGSTALARAKRRGMLRNAALVLGNTKYEPAFPILKNALNKEKDAIIQDACQWAIEKIENNA